MLLATFFLLPGIACYCLPFLSANLCRLLLFTVSFYQLVLLAIPYNFFLLTGISCNCLPTASVDRGCLLLLTVSFCCPLLLPFALRRLVLLNTFFSVDLCYLLLLTVLSIDWCYLQAIAYHSFCPLILATLLLLNYVFCLSTGVSCNCLPFLLVE